MGITFVEGVVTGPQGSATVRFLVDSVTLEMLGLVLNPLTRELQPMHTRLSAIGGSTRG